MEFHQGVVPFRDAHGEAHEIAARRFEEFYEAIRRENQLCKQKWRLPVRRTGELIYFDGMLDSLLRWARTEGLLRGQRNRWQESLIKTSGTG